MFICLDVHILSACLYTRAHSDSHIFKHFHLDISIPGYIDVYIAVYILSVYILSAFRWLNA